MTILWITIGSAVGLVIYLAYRSVYKRGSLEQTVKAFKAQQQASKSINDFNKDVDADVQRMVDNSGRPGGVKAPWLRK
jgi:hypothetical protein